MPVEILENTLLKLLVRRGTDADRRLVTLSEGELGYTTDTERLFVGNSTDKGGVVTGNKYQGANADLTSLAPSVTGDYAFETDTNELKIITAGTGAVADNWTVVANKITAGDATLDINTASEIAVGKSTAGGGLSADNVAHDALGNSIELDASNRVSLSAGINVDRLTKRSASTAYLSLPQELKIGLKEYDWPTNDPTNRSFLGSDKNNNLKWTIPSVVNSVVSPTTGSTLPVGTIVPFASAYSGANPIPYGWLDCNGADIQGTDYRDLSAVIGISYGGKDSGGSAVTNPDNATTFNVPDLKYKLLYGYFENDTANSTVYGVTTGIGALSSGPLSAFGTNYIIKAVDGIATPTLTVGKNLSCFINQVDKTDTTVDFLSGNITIEKTPPGQEVFDTQGNHTFTMPPGVHYVKFYVTGSGGAAGTYSGGAGATAIGHLSAAYPMRFDLVVGDAPTVKNQNGSSSSISISSTTWTDGDPKTLLVEAPGGTAGNVKPPAGRVEATIQTGEPYVLNGFSVDGAPGNGISTTGRSASTKGAASFWGSVPIAGGGQTTKESKPFGDFPGPGLIVIEWN